MKKNNNKGWTTRNVNYERKYAGNNASEDAGPMIRDTDAKNRGHQLRW
jgi:hypothetical protein